MPRRQRPAATPSQPQFLSPRRCRRRQLQQRRGHRHHGDIVVAGRPEAVGRGRARTGAVGGDAARDDVADAGAPRGGGRGGRRVPAAARARAARGRASMGRRRGLGRALRGGLARGPLWVPVVEVGSGGDGVRRWVGSRRAALERPFHGEGVLFLGG